MTNVINLSHVDILSPQNDEVPLTHKVCQKDVYRYMYMCIYTHTYFRSKQVLNSWSCAKLCWVLLCCTASQTHRERKRTKEKWSWGKLSVQDASCQWSRILKHACTGKHTQADTNAEFLMSEEPTGKHKGGNKQRKGGGARGETGREKEWKWCISLQPTPLIKYSWHCDFVRVCLLQVWGWMYVTTESSWEWKSPLYILFTHTNTHTDGAVLHSLMPRAIL